ncbi:MAG: serpin family protein [Clostridia bacterium]|nr:serpin family protein [Clostridia bacterium]
MRNKDEFKALVEERAAAQKRAAIAAARRRKLILSGVATVVLCIVVALPTLGLFTLPADVAEDGIVTTAKNNGADNIPPSDAEMAPTVTTPEFAPDDSEDDDFAEQPPLESGIPEGIEPTPDGSDPDLRPPFSDDQPNQDSPALESITDPVVGIKAVNRLVGLTPETVEDRKIDDAFKEAYMDFAVRLFQDADGIKDEDNLCFSPLSAMLALAMTANGAEDQTLAEMGALLGGTLSIEELNATLRTWVNKMVVRQYSQSTFSVANSIWVRQGVFNASPTFLQTNANYYQADFYEAPFDDSTADDINLWIKYHTNGLIKKMVEEINPNTMMYLINTLYLNAAWSDAYDDAQLSKGIFHGSDADTAATMMASVESNYLSMEGAIGFKKYMDGYTFAAILPDEGVDAGAFVASLTGEQLQAFLQSGTRAEVHAKLPSFSYGSSIRLTEILKSYIPTAMDPQADFLKMGETIHGNTLFIGNVQQNTVITLDKNGICAAAATIVDAPTGAEPPDALPIYYVTLDRPFVYAILDNATGLPIFIGVVEQL